MSKEVLEIVQKINADKKEDDTKSQKWLAEMGVLAISDDQKKLLQDQTAALASKFALDAGAAAAVESSYIQKMLKEIGEVAAGQSHFQEMIKNFAEASQATGVNEELNKFITSNLNGISTKVSDILPKENIIAPSYASLNYFPSPQERMADELAESNRVNKEILNEMRKQRLEKTEKSDLGDFDFLTVGGMGRTDVYSHLFALCNNRSDLAIVKYQNQTEDDLEQIVISDLKALEIKGRTRGCVIGTVRLLPASNNTVIQFVRKDVFWHDPVINPVLWQSFIEIVKEYFMNLHIERDVLKLKHKQAKQKGRYRLTQEEIKRRKKIVKQAESIFKESIPKKTWKQIAYELDIPERTLRDWRHNLPI